MLTLHESCCEFVLKSVIIQRIIMKNNDFNIFADNLMNFESFPAYENDVNE